MSNYKRVIGKFIYNFCVAEFMLTTKGQNTFDLLKGVTIEAGK